MDGSASAGIAQGEQLVAFAEALVGRDDAAIADARDALVAAAGEAVMIDAAGAASNFERNVRIAESTGVTLGRFEAVTADRRAELAMNAFAIKSAQCGVTRTMEAIPRWSILIELSTDCEDRRF